MNANNGWQFLVFEKGEGPRTGRRGKYEEIKVAALNLQPGQTLFIPEESERKSKQIMNALRGKKAQLKCSIARVLFEGQYGVALENEDKRV